MPYSRYEEEDEDDGDDIFESSEEEDEEGNEIDADQDDHEAQQEEDDNLSPFSTMSETPTKNSPEKSGKFYSDLEIINSWLDECNNHHGTHCQGECKAGDNWPALLIDVQSYCLIHGSEAKRYVCLSYVWGQVSCLQTTKGNLERLFRPGVLRERGLDGHRIPKTILQAIEVTGLIGERFCWVDQLCIIQDDEAIKDTQIDNMASIYANAFVTLVAAEGTSASDGLQQQINFKTVKSRENPYWDWHGPMLKRSAWSQRGWTFQELIFSQRAIFFFDNRVTWECHCAVWEDEVVKEADREPCRNRVSQDSQGFQYTTWPDLEEYARLVGEYNGRKLTFPSDALRAFSGVTSALARTYKGGFIYGHPTLFFDACLLWQPSWPLRRRQSNLDIGDHGYMPSWSWAGWEGELDLTLWASDYEYVHEKQSSIRISSTWLMPSVIVSSIVKWHHVNENGERTSMQSNSQQFRYLMDDCKGDVPAGWSRVRVDANISQTTDRRDFARVKCLYSHSSDPDTTFKYPIPITASSSPHITDIQFPLIACRTNRAWFTLGVIVSSPGACVSFSLLDSNGEWAGSIRLNHYPHTEFGLPSEYQRGFLCELIAISMCSAENPHEQVALQEEHFTKTEMEGRYEFYNVLFIEWKDGIAYRKALGRVSKIAWEAADKESVDVILG